MPQTTFIGFRPERAFLAGVEIRGRNALFRVEDSLEELAQLSTTAGLEVVGRTTQRLTRPKPGTYIGKGKLEEIKLQAEETPFEVLLFDDELSPGQQRNLENALGEGIKVLDRTALILDIFAQHASTREGRLQVELAQYEYRLPRLTRMWTHLARQAGGGGGRGGNAGVGLRGPGETQLEVDRREISRRIGRLKVELEEVTRHRSLYRLQRKRKQVPVVAIVGYTNAGKSTLLNALAGAELLVEDKLFATLDPTTRRVTLPDGLEILLTDTVGFIQKLPTQLVAAFRATLEEIAEADLLLHVVDASHPRVMEQMQAVEEVLRALGIADRPAVVALNKMDRVEVDGTQPGRLREVALRYPSSVPISAVRGDGLDDLLFALQHGLEDSLAPIEVQIPYARSELVSLVHERGIVEEEEFTEAGTRLAGRIPRRHLPAFEPHRLKARP